MRTFDAFRLTPFHFFDEPLQTFARFLCRLNDGADEMWRGCKCSKVRAFGINQRIRSFTRGLIQYERCKKRARARRDFCPNRLCLQSINEARRVRRCAREWECHPLPYREALCPVCAASASQMHPGPLADTYPKSAGAAHQERGISMCSAPLLRRIHAVVTFSASAISSARFSTRLIFVVGAGER